MGTQNCDSEKLVEQFYKRVGLQELQDSVEVIRYILMSGSTGWHKDGSYYDTSGYRVPEHLARRAQESFGFW